MPAMNADDEFCVALRICVASRRFGCILRRIGASKKLKRAGWMNRVSAGSGCDLFAEDMEKQAKDADLPTS
jgi:hypothetical protein